jgi:hypothetical protein
VHLISNATVPLAAVASAQSRGQRFAGSSGDEIWRTFFFGQTRGVRIDALAANEAKPRVLEISALRTHTFDAAGIMEQSPEPSLSGLTFRYRNARGGSVSRQPSPADPSPDASRRSRRTGPTASVPGPFPHGEP